MTCRVLLTHSYQYLLHFLLQKDIKEPYFKISKWCVYSKYYIDCHWSLTTYTMLGYVGPYIDTLYDIIMWVEIDYYHLISVPKISPWETIDNAFISPHRAVGLYLWCQRKVVLLTLEGNYCQGLNQSFHFVSEDANIPCVDAQWWGRPSRSTWPGSRGGKNTPCTRRRKSSRQAERGGTFQGINAQWRLYSYKIAKKKGFKMHKMGHVRDVHLSKLCWRYYDPCLQVLPN